MTTVVVGETELPVSVSMTGVALSATEIGGDHDLLGVRATAYHHGHGLSRQGCSASDEKSGSDKG
jgi:hypothetical protein